VLKIGPGSFLLAERKLAVTLRFSELMAALAAVVRAKLEHAPGHGFSAVFRTHRLVVVKIALELAGRARGWCALVPQASARSAGAGCELWSPQSTGRTALGPGLC